MTKKWVKWPGPGQYRGEGEWVDAKQFGMPEDEWQRCKDTGFLPVHEGEKPPLEQRS